MPAHINPDTILDPSNIDDLRGDPYTFIAYHFQRGAEAMYDIMTVALTAVIILMVIGILGEMRDRMNARRNRMGD